MLNQVIINGNLGKDPDLRTLPGSGKPVCNFSLATQRMVGDGNGGLTKKTVWVDVTAWSKNAENVGKYMKKGSNLTIVGQLDVNEWEDKNGGGKRTKLFVQAEKVIFGAKSENSGGASAAGGAGGMSQQEIDEIPF